MKQLILAQGAEHTNPERLKSIVQTVKRQYGEMSDNTKVIKYAQYIRDNYEPEFSEWDTHVYCNSDYVVEEKFDGYSYLNSEGRFFSKRLSAAKGNEGNPVEKTGHIPHLSIIMKNLYYQYGCDLHGELYVPGGISDDVTKILGCNEDEAIRRTKDNWDNRLKYMLIDIREYKGKSLINEPYFIRRAILEHMYYNGMCTFHNSPLGRSVSKPADINIAPILSGDPVENFRRIVLGGGEGVIFKKTSALYIPGKKPADNWIKGKKKITLDVVITGFNDGTGKNKSLFGSIEFGMYIDGKLKPCGNASSGLDDATRQTIAANPDKYIGTVMEIEAIQESVNSFRNAVFLRLRDDKDAVECTPLNIRINDRLV